MSAVSASASRSASADRARTGGLTGGLLLSGVAHAALIMLVILWATRTEPARPPVYRVDLVGAPPGARQAGVVTPAPVAETPPSPAPTPSGAEHAAAPDKAIPSKRAAVPIPKATPNPKASRSAGSKTAKPATKTATAPPRAGSGAVGGKGADVTNLKTDGIAFPYPGYLSNIVRQLTLSWTPRRISASLVTEVKFMIRRDGSVAGIEVVKSSNDRIYDSEASGAVEAVGTARSFGALPSGWKDDVLVVYFTFDYSLRP